MARKPQECAKKGSMKWLQLAINENSSLLNTLIARHLHPKPTIIEWFSPLRCDEYAEYSDRNFIDRLGLKLKNCPLNKFWPERGPNWDGLAKTDKGQVLLVEAKSYIEEMREKGTGASSDASIAKINCSLKKTQKFLDADLSEDWSKYPYYQYANRLAHLYLLAELNGIDAYLLMIYFLNDSDMGGPDSSGLWKVAIQKQYVDMGLPQNHRLSDRVINLYLDVCELGD